MADSEKLNVLSEEQKEEFCLIKEEHPDWSDERIIATILFEYDNSKSRPSFNSTGCYSVEEAPSWKDVVENILKKK